MGVVGAMILSLVLQQIWIRTAKRQNLHKAPPPGGKLLQIIQKFYWWVKLVCILGLGRIPATWGSGGNDFVIGLIANMGKDSKKAKFAQSPLGEIFCK